MIRFGMNIDHVATLRQLRAGQVNYPDVVEAGRVSLEAGADQITVHVRGDRRHVQEADLLALVDARFPVNLEMAATVEMTALALKAKPKIVCLVPEKREELTTEGGLDVVRLSKPISICLNKLREQKIPASLFIEPEEDQILASRDLGAHAVEFHTGRYAISKNAGDGNKEIRILDRAFQRAAQFKLAVHAGHGLDYSNVKDILNCGHLEEVNIGHSVVCRAVMVGLFEAVREMKNLIAR